MANLTPQEAARLLRLIPGAIQQAVETEQQLAIMDMEADIKGRVFRDGLDANGREIGQYSTDPIYVSVAGAKKRYGSQLPTSKLRGRGKGKRGNKFKNGNPRKSQYFEKGYAGFREYMGRDISKVNLDLTGNLMNSISSGTNGNVSVIEFQNSESSELAGHLEKNFGKTIFEANRTEVEKLTERLEDAVNRTIRDLFP